MEHKNHIDFNIPTSEQGITSDIWSYNLKLINEIEKAIKNVEKDEKCLMLLGGFNGHLGYLGDKD